MESALLLLEADSFAPKKSSTSLLGKGGTPTPVVKPRHAALLESGGQICHAPDLPLQAAAAQKPPAQGLDLDGGTLPLLQLPALLPGLARLVEELGFGGLAGAEHFRSL